MAELRTLDDLNRAHEFNENARAAIQYIRALAHAGNRPDAMALFRQWVGGTASAPAQVARFEKAAVAAHTTTGDPALAFKPLFVDFLRLLLPSTIAGQLLSLGARRLPLNVLTPVASDGTTAAFVAESAPTPAALLTIDALAYMRLHKIGVILGFSREWLASTDDRIVNLLGTFLQGPIRRAEDLALLSTDARVEGANPAGLLYGIASSGLGSPGSLDTDLGALWDNVRSGRPERPVFITSPRGALYLNALRIEGVPTFPQAGPLGGSIAGVPLITSAAASNRVILVDAACVGISDNGVVFDATPNATVQLDTTPADDAAQVLTSAFGQNVGFVKSLRFIDWTVAYSDAVGFVDLPISA